MAISENKIYPRTGDPQTVYLKNVIANDSIKIGDYTMYNDFVHDRPLSPVEQNFCLPVQIMRCTRFQHIHFLYFSRNGDWT